MTEEGRKFAIIPVTSSSAVILESRCLKCSTGWCVMYSVKRRTVLLKYVYFYYLPLELTVHIEGLYGRE